MSMHGARRVPNGADVVGARAGADCDDDACPSSGAFETPEAQMHAGILWTGGIGAAAVLALLATAVTGVRVVIAIGAL